MKPYLTPPDVLFGPKPKPVVTHWYDYVLQHPYVLVGLFGILLVFLSIAGSADFEFWIFKKLTLTTTTRVIAFITGLLFIFMMLGAK